MPWQTCCSIAGQAQNTLVFPRDRHRHALNTVCFPTDRQGPSQGPPTFSQGPPGTVDLGFCKSRSFIAVPGGPWENVDGPWDGPWRSLGKHKGFSACPWRPLGKRRRPHGAVPGSPWGKHRQALGSARPAPAQARAPPVCGGKAFGMPAWRAQRGSALGLQPCGSVPDPCQTAGSYWPCARTPRCVLLPDAKRPCTPPAPPFRCLPARHTGIWATRRLARQKNTRRNLGTTAVQT